MSIFSSIRFLDDNKEIVVAENGKLPELDGSLLKNLPSGTISVGNGLTGDGTETNPLKLDLSNYYVDTEINIKSSGANGGISIKKGSNGLEINNRISLITDSVSFTLEGPDVEFNGHPRNTAGGFAVVQGDGKLPSSIIPEQLETTSMEIVESSGTSFTLVNGKVFAHTLSADEVLAFDTSGFRAGICATCELWLTMPSVVVSFSFPETLVWVDGSAPSIDAGDMQYVIVLRWDGERLIANLAYSVEVA